MHLYVAWSLIKWTKDNIQREHHQIQSRLAQLSSLHSSTVLPSKKITSWILRLWEDISNHMRLKKQTRSQWIWLMLKRDKKRKRKRNEKKNEKKAKKTCFDPFYLIGSSLIISQKKKKKEQRWRKKIRQTCLRLLSIID